MKDLRNEIKNKTDIKDYDATMLLNLAPGSVEEAQALIPGLAAVPEDTLNELIQELTKAKLAR